MPKEDGGASLYLSVDGAAQYKKALKDAQAQLKLLQAELKRDTTALGNNANAEKKNAIEAENLRKKIEQQKKIVEAAKKALEQTTAKYPENTAAITRWRTTLANAESQLNRLNNELDGLGQNMEQATVAVTDTAQQTANFATGLGKVADVAKGVGGAVSTAMNNTLNIVRGIVDQMSDLIEGAMAQVGEYKAITDVYGGSDVDVQRMLIRFGRAGLNAGNMASTIQKLIAQTHANGKNLLPVLQSIGVGDESEYASHWDYYQAVIQGLMGMQDRGEMLAKAQKLFGNGNFDEIGTLYSHWNDGSMQAAAMEAAGGIISQDTIDQVDAFADKLNQLKIWWDQLQTVVGAGLIVNMGLGTIPDRLTDILSDLTTIFSLDKTAAEKQEAVVRLEADIKLLTDDIANVLHNFGVAYDDIATQLSESDDPVVASLGEVLKAIGNITKWLGQNLPDIIDTIKKAWPFIRANLVTKALFGETLPTTIFNTLTSIGQLLVGIKLMGLGGSGAAAAASAGGNAAAGSFLAAAGTKIAGGAVLAAYETLKPSTNASKRSKDDQYVIDTLNKYGSGGHGEGDLTTDFFLAHPDLLRDWLSSGKSELDYVNGKMFGGKTDEDFEAWKAAMGYTDTPSAPVIDPAAEAYETGVRGDVGVGGAWTDADMVDLLDDWLQISPVADLAGNPIEGQGGGVLKPKEILPINLDITNNLDGVQLSRVLSPLLVEMIRE